jgi:RNA polymerase sigma-70 factor (ECF subfamily)
MPISLYTDEELVSLIAQDDEGAFRILYKRYWKRMLAKAYARLDSEADAEEVVQDVFVNLWKRRFAIRLQYSFHTYIASAVRYEVLARIARDKTLQFIPLESLGENSMEDLSTMQRLSFEDLLEELENTVQTLPDKCQLVFRLRLEQGLSERQIAETLHIAPKTVEAHMSKALRIIRTALHHHHITSILLLEAFLCEK